MLLSTFHQLFYTPWSPYGAQGTLVMLMGYMQVEVIVEPVVPGLE